MRVLFYRCELGWKYCKGREVSFVLTNGRMEQCLGSSLSSKYGI